MGAKNQPVYRLVVVDSRTGPKSGKHVEVVGGFDPRLKKGERVTIKADRVKHWLDHGAQPSDTVYNYLVTAGIIDGKKKNVLPKKSPQISPEAEAKVGEAEKSKPVESDQVESQDVEADSSDQVTEETQAEKDVPVETEEEPVTK